MVDSLAIVVFLGAGYHQHFPCKYAVDIQHAQIPLVFKIFFLTPNSFLYHK